MITRTYKTAGTLALQADVYGADTPTDVPKPAIVWIHGGALIMGNRAGIVPAQLDRYVDAGFVVVCIDYRFAPETKLPANAEDIEDAFRWLRSIGADEFGIDPAQIGVVGHSAGGYLTLLAGHRVDPAPQALVSFYGYGNVAGDWYSKPDPFYNTFDRLEEGHARRAIGERELVDGAADTARRDYYLWCRQNGLWPLKVGGHEPVSELDWFTPYSPAENVSEAYPPTLLLHGDADTDVPHAHSVHMAGRLKAAGIEHDFITIPDGPHGFDRDPAPELVETVSCPGAGISENARLNRAPAPHQHRRGGLVSAHTDPSRTSVIGDDLGNHRTRFIPKAASHLRSAPPPGMPSLGQRSSDPPA